ncbi:hypothetical protein P148_SR1C00001G0205 [candidate division SR1 bacterium RAAC1_SR1_1]|nr:hypothetical protein P148_SR1C00001G0205 [candidate division SR1 bacterium RAAC1_SR1_1]
MLTDQRKQLLDDEYLIARNATDYTREEINEEEAYQNIKDFIKKHIHQVLVGKLEEDIWLTEKEIKKLPYRVGHFLRYSEYRGIKYYVLKKNDLKYISIGVFGSTGARTNEYYFDKLITDPDIQPIVQTTTFQLSEVLGNHGKRIKWKQGMQKKWRRLTR